jgi:xanthine dehydrogenase accessory factor
MSQQPDVVEYLMTCHSGGTLEIFLEPIRPRPHLVILGDTPTARTLAALGDLLGFRVHPVLPSPASDAADTQEPEALSAALLDRLDRPFVVIATMGAADEEPLEIALRGPTAYVALVASPRRAAVLRDYLAERGVTPEQLQKLRAPAGLNLGGQTQEEIALSIMAEIVQVRATLAPTPPARSPSPPPAAIADAIDPICGMSVSPNEIRFVTHHAGSDYYFCCGGCKRKFDADPARYLAPTAQPVKGPA